MTRPIPLRPDPRALLTRNVSALARACIAKAMVRLDPRSDARAPGAGSAAMTKKKPRYESRVFDGCIIHSAEIERIHKEVLDFDRIEAISEPMRELIEDLWPELVSKLPPKRPHG
jgi:hypothetical protein